MTDLKTIAGFAGEVVEPDHPEYDTHREIWNAMVDRRPALIARCTSADDVAAAIRHAREAGLEIGVQVRRPQRPGPVRPGGRPDDRPGADGRRPGRSGAAAGMGRRRRAAPEPRPRDRAARPGDHGRQRVAHRRRRADARWRHGLAGAPVRAGLRQRRDVHGRDCRWRGHARDRHREPGPVLGSAWRWRQLRRRHRVRVPAPPDDRPGARRRNCISTRLEPAARAAIRAWRDMLPERSAAGDVHQRRRSTAGDVPFLPASLRGRPVVLPASCGSATWRRLGGTSTISAGASARLRPNWSRRCATSTSRAAATTGTTTACGGIRPVTT